MTTVAVASPRNTLHANGRTYRAFFLRGHMRSGTNWTAALLNLHPQISCRGEYHFERLAKALRDFADFPHFDRDRAAVARALPSIESIARDVLTAAVAFNPDALWHGDRTPAPIDHLIPDAPTIYIYRDGRDVLVSTMYHRFRLGFPFPDPTLEQRRHDFARNPSLFLDNPHLLLDNETVVRERIRTWASRVRSDLQAARRAGTDPHTGGVLVISYEQLLNDTHATRNRMYEFLGLDPDQARPIGTDTRTAPGFDRPEDPSSFYRSGRAGDWKRYFTDQTRDWFKQDAGDLLIELGYEHDTNW